jgi:hypothetical protein
MVSMIVLRGVRTTYLPVVGANFPERFPNVTQPKAPGVASRYARPRDVFRARDRLDYPRLETHAYGPENSRGTIHNLSGVGVGVLVGDF